MIGPDLLPPGMSERAVRKWLKQSHHPAVKAARRYYLIEYTKRLLKACFVGGPAIAFLLLVAIMLIEHNRGNEPLVIEYAAIQFLMTLSYSIGFMNSVAFNLMNGWHSPLDEVVDNYLADQSVNNAWMPVHDRQ